MLIHASRTRSSVGRTPRPDGASIVRPLQRPATMRMSGLRMSVRTDVRNARLESAFPPEVVPLESERDIHRQRRIELAYSRCKAPTDCFELAAACGQAEL